MDVVTEDMRVVGVRGMQTAGLDGSGGFAAERKKTSQGQLEIIWIAFRWKSRLPSLPH